MISHTRLDRAGIVRLGALVSIGVVAVLAGLFTSADHLTLVFATFGLSVMFVAIGSAAVSVVRSMADSRSLRALLAVIDQDPHPCLVTNRDGSIVFANPTAQDKLGTQAGASIIAALSPYVADPSGLVTRLTEKLQRRTSAVEEYGTDGHAGRVSVLPIGASYRLWRVALADHPDQAAGTLSLPIITVGARDRIVFMNPAARRLFGHRPDTLGDLHFETPPEDGQLCDVVPLSGPSQRKKTLVISGPDGKRDIVFVPPDAPVAENAGDFSIDVVPIAMIEIDLQGRVISINRDARQQLGWTVPVGACLSEVFDGLSPGDETWINPASGRFSDFLRVRRAGAEHFVQISIRKFRHETGVRMLAVLTDATELKSLEAQFIHGQKMQAIGQLAGGVAHDFNNLLTAISGHCDLLLLNHDRDDPDYPDLMQIVQNANRAAALVGQLLAFSRKQNTRPELIDLRNSLSDLTHLLNRLVGEKVTLTLDKPGTLPPILIDKRQIEQVLMNLVVNARDSMPRGGEITLSTEEIVIETPWRHRGVTVPSGRYVSICVQDTGVGIDPTHLDQIFEPFFTTKNTGEGTGLGLSTVYGIVRQAEGIVLVDSVLAVGTTFTLLFPARGGPALVTPAEPADRVAVNAARTGGTVLLVEDEAPVRAFASRALRLTGLTVLEACSGEEAIDRLAELDGEVDVIVSDVIMPGLDGPAWVARAFANMAPKPVVFVSGYPEDVFERKDAQLSGAVFLPKPFSLKDLTQTVQGQLDRLP